MKIDSEFWIAIQHTDKITCSREMNHIDDKGATFYADLGGKCIEICVSGRNSFGEPHHDVNILFGEKNSMSVIYQGVYPLDSDICRLVEYCTTHYKKKMTLDKRRQKHALDWLTKYNAKNRVRGS